MESRNQTKNYFIVASIVVFLVAIFFYFNNTSGKLDTFAQCLKDKGAAFYGAFWCPHCQNQKAMFGSSKKYLPYFECSTPDGQSQTQECTDKGVTSYPTWFFKDDTTLTGEVELSTLASKTSCVLPQ